MAGVLQVSSCRLVALSLAGVAITACRQSAPAEVQAQIPEDAQAAASLDVAGLLAWSPVARDRSRLLGVLTDAILQAAEDCDVGLATGRVTAAWDAQRVTVVLAASDVGRSSALRCLASGTQAQGLAVDTAAEPIALTVAGHAISARAAEDDTLVLHIPLTDDAVAVDPDDLGLTADSPLHDAIAGVDNRSAIWAVAADSADTPWATVFGGGRDVAIDVALDDDGAEVALAGTRDDGEPSEIGAALGRALAAVYLPTSIAERIEVDRDDGKLAAHFEVAIPEAYALDLRWLGEPAQTPDPAGTDALSPEALALVQQWSTPEPPAPTPVATGEDGGLIPGTYPKIGIETCDEYIHLYVTCIEAKLPPSSIETTREALETTIEAWQQAAATPAGRSGLEEACRAASDAVRSTCA